MEIVYDLWHLAFANLIEERAPPNVSVQSEVRLTIEPLRADLLLIRRTGPERRDADARVLRGIWPRLSTVTIVEFKSPTDSSFRPGDLVRLWTYGSLYHATHIAEIVVPAGLTLLLVVPSITPTLGEEIAAMGWAVRDLGGGYRQVDGAVYALYLAVTNEVAEAEHDGFLRLFSRLKSTDPAARGWIRHWVKETTMSQNIKEIPGYVDVFREIIEELAPEMLLDALTPEQRLAGLAPEQRLAGLAPEQRLAGLSEEQRVLALADETLRQLPDGYLRTLSADAQEAIRRRIRRPGVS